MRALQFLLLLLACLVVIAWVKRVVLAPGPDPTARIAETRARLDAVEAALAAYAAEHGMYPRGEHWRQALGLSEAEVLDPFAAPASPETLALWSNGRYYALSSYGPDGAGTPLRYFHADMLDKRSPQELQALIDSGEIYSDIRFRAAFYDPTNGLFTFGDMVRLGGPARPD